jgi:hypothetical protein
VVVFDWLLLQQGSEEGDLVGHSICRAGGQWRGFVEFTHAISTGKFLQDGGDAVAGVDIVVGLGASDGLEGRAEFAPPCFAGRELYVGEEDKSKLGVINDDAIGEHAGNFGMEEFNVGDDLF